MTICGDRTGWGGAETISPTLPATKRASQCGGGRLSHCAPSSASFHGGGNPCSERRCPSHRAHGPPSASSFNQIRIHAVGVAANLRRLAHPAAMIWSLTALASKAYCSHVNVVVVGCLSDGRLVRDGNTTRLVPRRVRFSGEQRSNASGAVPLPRYRRRLGPARSAPRCGAFRRHLDACTRWEFEPPVRPYRRPSTCMAVPPRVAAQPSRQPS